MILNEHTPYYLLLTKPFSMKRSLPLFFILASIALNAQRNDVTISDLIRFTSISSNQFQSVIAKKGFRQNEYIETTSLGEQFFKTSRDKNITRSIERIGKEDTATIYYETSDPAEFRNIQAELVTEGFYYPASKKQAMPLYQKGPFSVQPIVKTTDGATTYCFQIQRKLLPSSFSFRFAEDFLHITSHEYLADIFGEANVKRDEFHFTEQDKSKCTVLFPNTSMQLVVIWKDEDNYKDVLMILVGANTSQSSYKTVEQNKWTSSQGVRIGMSLSELNELNRSPVWFYGWETEQPGMVISNKRNQIDLSNMAIQLSCLECGSDKQYTNSNMINSTNLLKKGERVYVSTLVVFPKQP
jgi:hypothetical protein